MFAACACLGPMYNEPYCYCQMEARKLPLNDAAREVERLKDEADFKRLFGPGGEFYRNRKDQKL